MNANDRQVGGTHYKVELEHWDFIGNLGAGYFEGQITKYVTRHRSKNKLQDLEKALHFAQKKLEFVRRTSILQSNRGASPSPGDLRLYGQANDLGRLELDIVYLVLSWRTQGDLQRAIDMLNDLIAVQYTQPGLEARERAAAAEAVVVRGLDGDAMRPGSILRPRLEDGEGDAPGAGYVNQDR